jgi:hypothetical protein
MIDAEKMYRASLRNAAKMRKHYAAGEAGPTVMCVVLVRLIETALAWSSHPACPRPEALRGNVERWDHEYQRVSMARSRADTQEAGYLP